MKQAFEELFKKKEELQKQLTAVNNAIDSLKPLCTHEWVDDGRDSHHDWEKCSICREIRKA